MSERPIPRHLRNAAHWPIELPEVKCGLCGDHLIGLCNVSMAALRVLIEDHRSDCRGQIGDGD